MSCFGKRGQIGKLIVILPVMFFIFVVMSIFIFFSATFTVKGEVLGDKSSPVFLESVIGEEDLMLKQVEMNFLRNVRDESGERLEPFSSKMRVLDAAILYSNKQYPAGTEATVASLSKILSDAFVEMMKSDEAEISTGNPTCLFLFKSASLNLDEVKGVAHNPDSGIFGLRRKGTEVNGLGGEPYFSLYIPLIRSISFIGADGKLVYIDYYYGRCLY